jgi:hypothetical protein
MQGLPIESLERLALPPRCSMPLGIRPRGTRSFKEEQAWKPHLDKIGSFVGGSDCAGSLL